MLLSKAAYKSKPSIKDLRVQAHRGRTVFTVAVGSMAQSQCERGENIDLLTHSIDF